MSAKSFCCSCRRRPGGGLERVGLPIPVIQSIKTSSPVLTMLVMRNEEALLVGSSAGKELLQVAESVAVGSAVVPPPVGGAAKY